MRGLECDAGDGKYTYRRCTVTDASHQDDRNFLRYPINVVFDEDLYAIVEMFESHDKCKGSENGREWPRIISQYLFVLPVLADPMPMARLWSVKNGMSNPSDNECCDDGQNDRAYQNRPTQPLCRLKVQRVPGIP